MLNRKTGTKFQERYKKQIITSSLLLLCVYILYDLNDSNGTSNHETGCGNLENLQYDDPALISCLKNHYLNPPSALPYNLSNPLGKNPSQYGQNVFAHSLLKRKRDGFFIECGALDGEYLSNTLMLERNYGWTGLLIEADPNNYRGITSKQRKAWTSHSCLSPTTTAQKLTLVGIDYGGASGGLTLMNNSVPLQGFPGYVNTKRVPVEVQCFPLYTYLLALNRPVVDYFSLDVEGADFEILKTIPFDKIIFKVLEVEVHWVNEGKEAVRTFLEGHGYIFVKEISVDYIFVHNSVDLTDFKTKWFPIPLNSLLSNVFHNFLN